MKKFKLVALVLAVLMMTACFVGCEKTEKVALNVTVTVIAEDDVLFGPVTIPMERPVDDMPTILEAVQEAFILNEVAYENDDMAILSISGLADKVEGDYTYWWEYTVNGEAPTSGRAGTITVADGDIIVYNYVKVLTSELIAAEGD